MQQDRAPNSFGVWRQRYETLTGLVADGGEGLSPEVAETLITFEQFQQMVYDWGRLHPENDLRDLPLVGKVQAMGVLVAPWRLAAAQLLWTRYQKYVGGKLVRLLAVTEPADVLSLAQAEIAVGIRNWHGVLDLGLIWGRMTTVRGRGAGRDGGVPFGGELAGRMLTALAIDGEAGIFDEADRLRAIGGAA